METIDVLSAGIAPNEPMRDKSKNCPSRVALRSYRKCPRCDKTLMRHTLLYRHVCKGDAELEGKTLIDRMDERIKRRMAKNYDNEPKGPEATVG